MEKPGQKLKQLASHITKLEGKKSQARVGDVREILAILSDVVATEFIEGTVPADQTIHAVLLANGLRRLGDKAKVKK